MAPEPHAWQRMPGALYWLSEHLPKARWRSRMKTRGKHQ